MLLNDKLKICSLVLIGLFLTVFFALFTQFKCMMLCGGGEVMCEANTMVGSLNFKYYFVQGLVP